MAIGLVSSTSALAADPSVIYGAPRSAYLASPPPAAGYIGATAASDTGMPAFSPSGYALEPHPASWSGAYIGGSVGRTRTTAKAGIPIIGDFNGFGLDGAGLQLTLGFDYQFAGRFIAGIAGDVGYDSALARTQNNGVDTATIRGGAEWALRGRLGALVTDETMIYGTIGFAQKRYVALGAAKDYSGAVIGGGIETRIQGNWYARAEYTQTIFEFETLRPHGRLGTPDQWHDQARYRPQVRRIGTPM